MEKDVAALFPRWIHNIVGTILLCTSVCSTITHIPVLYLFVKKQLLKTPTNILTFLLFLNNLIMGCAATPLATAASYSAKWIFGHFGCVYYAFITSVCAYMAISILTMIAVERFIVVVIEEQNSSTNKQKVKWMISGCMIYSLFLSLCPLFGWNSYTLEAMHTSCSLYWQSDHVKDYSYSITVIIVAYLLPTFVICFTYSCIVRKITQAIYYNTLLFLFVIMPVATQVNKQVDSIQNHRQRMKAKKQNNLTMTVLYMIVSYLLSWTPYALVSFWSVVFRPGDIHPVLATVPALMAKIFIIWNPFIYIQRNTDFRAAFLEEFPFASRCFNNRVRPANDDRIGRPDDVKITSLKRPSENKDKNTAMKPRSAIATSDFNQSKEGGASSSGLVLISSMQAMDRIIEVSTLPEVESNL